MSEELDRSEPTAASRALLALFVPVMLLTGLPKSCDLHERLAETIDPLVDVTGTWQIDWKLFAPEVDKINVALGAELRLSNGEVVAWQSPDWRGMGPTQRFRHFRHMAFFDGVRRDANAGAWPSLARHLVRRLEPALPTGVEVEAITLARLWSDIPPPPSAGPWPSAREYVDSYSRFVFFESEFPESTEEAP